MRDVTYSGGRFRFHNPNGYGWVLLWSDAWENVDAAAVALGWKRVHHGSGTYGHVSYHL